MRDFYQFIEKSLPTGYILVKAPILFSVTENENNKLPAGKYTYKETFALDGYLINEESFSIELKKDGERSKETKITYTRSLHIDRNNYKYHRHENNQR
jgi:uncharacterized surface anchored protein